jgi:hypothetical protein
MEEEEEDGRSSIYLFVCLFSNLFIYLFIYLFILLMNNG